MNLVKSVISNQPKTSTNPPSPPHDLPLKRGRRRSRLAIIGWFGGLLVCLIGVGATAFFDLLFNYGVAYGPQLDPIPSVKADQLGAYPLGVNVLTQLEDPNSPDVDRSLDMVKAAGFGFVRMLLPWEEIEKSAGVYDWYKFDRLVEKAQARQLQILFRLDRPPPWSRLTAMERLNAQEKTEITGPPDSFADFYKFAGLVAARYRGRVKYYQIWNEPNLPGEWNNQKADAPRYTELLKGAYGAIKVADPTAAVLCAPLAPTDVLDPARLELNDLVYLDGMYRAGAKDYFDILSLQIYGLGYSPDFRYIQPSLGSQDLKRVNFNRPASVHEVMIRNGDGAKPAWAAEYGWVSIPASRLDRYNAPPAPGFPKQWGESVSETDRADYLVKGIERVRREWPWIGVINVWFFRADTNLAKNLDDPTNYFSIVGRDFQPRPAYTRLQSYIAQNRNTVYTGWQPLAPGTTLLQPMPDGALKTHFEGERLELVTRPDAPTTDLRVGIDGGAVRNLRVGPSQRVSLAEGLTDGPHDLLLNGLAASSMAGFYVSRDNHWAWLIASAMALFGLGAIISGAGLMMSVGQGVSKFWLWLGPQVGRWPGLIWPARERWTPALMVGALLLYYYAPLPVALAGLGLFFGLCFVRPDWAIGLAALTAPLFLHPRNLRSGTGGTLEFSLSEVIIVALALAWLIGLGWRVGRGEVRPTVRLGGLAGLWWQPLILPMVALFGLATLSLLTPPSYHLKEALREYREVVAEPIILLGLTLAFLGRRGSLAVVRLVDFMVVSGVGVALLGIWQAFFPTRSTSDQAVNVPSQVGCTVPSEGVIRVCSLFSHPDSLGLFLGRLIPLVFCLIVFYRETPWRLSRRRQLYTLALLPMLITLGLSFSRGAWLGCAAALLVILIAAGTKRGLLAFGGAALLGLAALPFVKVERIVSVLDPTSGSGATRLYIWQSAIQMIKDHPLTGLGLDQFLYYYNPQYVNPLAWTERFTSHPHNMILDFWLRLGILGPVILVWFLVSFFRVAWRISRAKFQPLGLRMALGLGLLGSMTDFAVHGLVDNSYFMVDLAILCCLSFGMLEILRRQPIKEQDN